mmetsp:Transcript_32789/g.61535  ORF Transcript_32789/g.61535 Transcript_32789/m.61535 type:complete len:142 (+) Transcript_32789:46-471(+)
MASVWRLALRRWSPTAQRLCMPEIGFKWAPTFDQGIFSDARPIVVPAVVAGTTCAPFRPVEVLSSQPFLPSLFSTAYAAIQGPRAQQATEILSNWCDFLRPREFSVRLDVKMKRGAAPYPRNPYKKKPVPKVKGIVRKLIK